jgi:pimeloyl-ACP methyl ester carboxylesterase
MVFLSGSFKHPGRAPEFDTAYERNLEAMLKAAVRQPSLAERLRVLFASAAPRGAGRGQPDGEASALESEVRRPFRDAHTLVVYARQHLEFWSHDETATGPEVRVPLLGIAGERDEVVSPFGFQNALSHFPQARYVEVKGAAHYCFYERPDLIADLIEDFVARTTDVKQQGVETTCM